MDVYYMRDNHTFKRLSRNIDEALEQISHEFNSGYTCGMLCSKVAGFKNIHSEKPLESFLEKCRAELINHFGELNDMAIPPNQQPPAPEPE